MGSSKIGYGLIECKSCGLIFLENMAIEYTDDLYPKDYIAFKEKISAKKNWFGWVNQEIGLGKKYRAVFKKVKHIGTVLDVGCATGLLLDLFNSKGWEVYGVEPSKYAADYARNKLGLNVHIATVQNNHFPDDFFDVVMLWDVLEHLENPFTDMIELARILKPGGLLILNIPNIDSNESKIFKQFWAGWDIPRHKYLFSRTSLEKLINPLNLSIHDEKSITGAHGGLVLSLNFAFQDLRLSPKLVKALRIFVNSFVFRLITYPFLAIENSFNKSSFIAYFIVKNG